MKINLLFLLASLTTAAAPPLAMSQSAVTSPARTTLQTASSPEGAVPIRSLPFTITQCGSYFLVGCLTGTSVQNGITVQADDVTLDLNGFTLQGAGSQAGIHVESGKSNVHIFNGVVRNWGLGVNASSAFHGRFESLSLSNNATGGLSAGADCLVASCTASGSAGGAGFKSGGDGGLWRNCTASQNNIGFYSDNRGWSFSNCTARDNSDDGFHVRNAALQHCTAAGNVQTGFDASASLLEYCFALDNAGNGFDLTNDTYVVACLAENNSGTGFTIREKNNRLERNRVSGAATTSGFHLDFNATANLLAGNTTFQLPNAYWVQGTGNHLVIVTTVVGAGAWDNFAF